jgi:NADH:ubiquinone oxidoreductase subunit 4 (subunit M)
MNAAQRELFEGLGLAVLAWMVTCGLLYGAFVAFGKADWARLVPFGVLGLIGLVWSIRFTRAQFAAYAAEKAGQRRGQ